jgi:hypothetical protein
MYSKVVSELLDVVLDGFLGFSIFLDFTKSFLEEGFRS